MWCTPGLLLVLVFQLSFSFCNLVRSHPLVTPPDEGSQLSHRLVEVAPQCTPPLAILLFHHATCLSTALNQSLHEYVMACPWLDERPRSYGNDSCSSVFQCSTSLICRRPLGMWPTALQRKAILNTLLAMPLQDCRRPPQSGGESSSVQANRKLMFSHTEGSRDHC